jgi:hypothetical protein
MPQVLAQTPQAKEEKRKRIKNPIHEKGAKPIQSVVKTPKLSMKKVDAQLHRGSLFERLPFSLPRAKFPAVM